MSLAILMNGVEAGRLDYKRGRLTLSYLSSWRERRDATPISLSMPLTAETHPDAVVRPFLWGLLPDNEQIIQEWARRFHVSARQPFDLIGAVGEDCAGAVQCVTPERLEGVLSGGRDGVEWLTDKEVAERLAGLRTNKGAWRRSGDAGQFSLAGAQPKIGVDPPRWSVGYSVRAGSDHAYPEAALRRPRSSGRERALLPVRPPAVRPPRGGIESPAIRRGSRHRH